MEAKARFTGGAGVPTKHATYQIVLPIIYLHCFKGKFTVTLYADLEPKTHHQTPMTCTYGFSHFRHLQNCCNRDEIQFLNT